MLRSNYGLSFARVVPYLCKLFAYYKDSVAGFDPSLGTLNEVFLFADESVTTTGSITNLSQETGPWQIQLDGSIKAQFTNAAGDSGVGTPPVPPVQIFTIPSIDPNPSYFGSANYSSSLTTSISGSFSDRYRFGWSLCNHI